MSTYNFIRMFFLIMRERDVNLHCDSFKGKICEKHPCLIFFELERRDDRSGNEVMGLLCARSWAAKITKKMPDCWVF